MSYLAVHGDWVAVSIQTRLLVFSEQSKEYVTLDMPQCRPAEKKTGNKDVSTEESNNVLGMGFSICGMWIAAFSSAKQLVVWETKKWSLVSARYMPKTATSMKFTPDSQAIVVVDKAGDALKFSLLDLQKEGEMILGHLSMLLDVIVTPDGKNIITCDRDEKIRVSHFPNAYNIISYCLGHKEFVSSLHLLPHLPSNLVSCSGDGTLRLWEFCTGQPLATYDCSKDALEHLSPDPDCLVEMEGGKPLNLIIKKICCLKVSNSSSLICALLYGLKGCLIYSVENNQIQLVQSILSEETILDFCIRDSGELIVRSVATATGKSLQCYTCEDAKMFTSSAVSENIKLLMDKMSKVLSSASDTSLSKSNITQLLKRKFDNVKDYYEQKRARLGEGQKIAVE